MINGSTVKAFMVLMVLFLFILDRREDYRMEQRFKGADRQDRIFEFIRLKGHTIMAALLTTFNVFFIVPIGFLTWFTSFTGTFSTSWIHEINSSTFYFLWYLPLFTWFYTTVTYPIKNGFKTVIDFTETPTARRLSAILNITPFFLMGWAGSAKHTTENFLPYLSSISVPTGAEGQLLVDDLDSLLLILYVAPVIVTIILIFAMSRHYQINKDIMKDQFYKWEAPFITRITHPLEMDMCDVIVGYEKKSKKPIVIKEDQRYLHEGVFGATGSGKTSTSILLRIAQDLIKIATGRRKMGLILLEPKGDAVDDVLTLAKKLGIPDDKIKVIDPTKSMSIKYNPFAGPLETAASSFEGTLNALTGDQDEFFKGQQNEAAKTYTMLAKIRFGNLTNITHLQRMFTDPRYLANIVEEVRIQISSRFDEPDLTPDVKRVLDSWHGIVRYFEDEVLDYKTFRVQNDVMKQTYPPDHRYAGKQVVENKKDKFVTGAKKYLNEIALNSLLSSLFVSTEDDQVFDADEFLKDGGILLVNTALAELEELSLMFGQFFIRQLQSAVFRRPKEGRIPIFLYVDEFPLYVNEAFERFLTLGRSYKVGSLIAMQSLGQLDNVVKGFKETVLSNASSKTVFGRGTVNDNKYFSEEFGEHLVVEESLNESSAPMTTENPSWGIRMNTSKMEKPRFSPTVIRELPFKHMIVQVVDENNSIKISTEAIGKFVHEARFLKKYFKVKPEEIKSTNERDFEISELVETDTLDKINFMATQKQDKVVVKEQMSLDVGEIQEFEKVLEPRLVKETSKVNKNSDSFVQSSLPIFYESDEQPNSLDSHVSIPSKEAEESVDNLVKAVQQDIPEYQDVVPAPLQTVSPTQPVPLEKDEHIPVVDVQQDKLDFETLFSAEASATTDVEEAGIDPFVAEYVPSNVQPSISEESEDEVVTWSSSGYENNSSPFYQEEWLPEPSVDEWINKGIVPKSTDEPPVVVSDSKEDVNPQKQSVIDDF